MLLFICLYISWIVKREKIEQRERRSDIKKCYTPEYKAITKERILKEKETLPQQYTKIMISKSAMMIALLQAHLWRYCKKAKRKRQKRQIAQSEEKFKIMAGQEIVKEYFSESKSLQNIAEHIPYREFCFFAVTSVTSIGIKYWRIER